MSEITAAPPTPASLALMPPTPASLALPDNMEEVLTEWDFPPRRPLSGYLFGLPFDFWAFLRARWGSDMSTHAPRE
jgi:hypothetical protein